MTNKKIHPKKSSLSSVRSTLSFFIQVLLIIFVVRGFIFEPFYIPSGSMQATLLKGDYVFVWKNSYGYSKYSIPLTPIDFDGRYFNSDRPSRGDVAVFRNPGDVSQNYIKRITGLPNDNLYMRQGRLFINGGMVFRRRIEDYIPLYHSENLRYPRYIEELPNGYQHEITEISGDAGFADNTPLYKVPAKHYFGMGDNRDGSQDSRFLDAVGYVPEDNFVGRAAFIFFSVHPDVPIWQFWRKIRFSRMFTTIK